MSTCNRCGATVADIPCHRCGAYFTEEVNELSDPWVTPAPRKSWMVENAAKLGMTKQEMRVKLYGAAAAAMLEADDEARP